MAMSKGPGEGESIADMLASIRAVVSAETDARVTGDGETVLMLTQDMRRDAGGLAEGLDDDSDDDDTDAVQAAAPILDEESLRSLINQIVREELQGELGDRIGRNLRKMIRREIVQILDEREAADPKA
ncbi:hypothetical protein HNP73_000499 [Amaricoccus macauensis]|uniref:Uncharacterized protein n=1 Tax=Amaricoccus macauensis TaxID=57001 RepID=A0A840SK95_9RHOB|nr:hypothetical protein [Amaricoccus macauensis]MBB5220578.1 hypothetical protein [Amaricoccus macauensis]